MSAAVVYLHGFNSSANALKAQQCQQWLQCHRSDLLFFSPNLPDTPDKAAEFLLQYIAGLLERFDGRLLLIGSSLGGFYATWLAEHFNLQAVLVNPAVRPHKLMHHYLGWNENPYSRHRYELTAAHIKTLQSLYCEQLENPARFLVLLQMADEVLDATEASSRFYQSACRIAPAGDHRFENFDHLLPEIFRWAEL